MPVNKETEPLRFIEKLKLSKKQEKDKNTEEFLVF